MLWNHPQMLWGLAFLAIPILIHLLRLRKYRKTPFTNVRVLQRLVSESNKSSTLKKWLLLLTRLGLVAALVIAFSQPYKAKPDAEAPRDIVVYLDNSFSMQAPINGTTAMERAVQDLLQNMPERSRINLITNNGQFRDLSGATLRETLLGIEFTHLRMGASSLGFRAQALFTPGADTLREFWMISDFRGLDFQLMDTVGLGAVHAVPIRALESGNMSLDSALIRSVNPDLLELEVLVSLTPPQARKPLSLYNGDTLIAKSAPEITADGKGRAVFSLPARTELEGTLKILDEGLTYDNSLYFSIRQAPKIRVLSIGPGPEDYLKRLYTQDEFDFASSGTQELDYTLIPLQDMIVLNELEKIPEVLSGELLSFLQEGGTLLIIPGTTVDIVSYNRLLGAYSAPLLGSAVQAENRVTDVTDSHPLFRDVFESEVRNFEFPSVESYFQIGRGGLPILNFQNGELFLSARGNLFLFAAALNSENSNFRQSPLVVPTLYNMARQSLPYPLLYYTIGQPAALDIDEPLEEDRIFRLQGPDYSFIPRQQGFSRKTRLNFDQEPLKDGHYRIVGDASQGALLSFNYPRNESASEAAPQRLPDYVVAHDSAAGLIERYQNDTRITSLWKWFVILALIFALIELILQKFMR